MRHGNPSIAHSTAFRLATLYVALFLVSFLVANGFAYNMIAAYLAERLDSHVMERFREIETAYAANGIPGAVEMIGRHGPAIRRQETIYALSGADGTQLAGNIVAPTIGPNFSNWALLAPDGTSSSYRLFHAPLGKDDLIVGVSYDDTDRLRNIALASFGWATVIVLAAGLGGGTILALKIAAAHREALRKGACGRRGRLGDEASRFWPARRHRSFRLRNQRRARPAGGQRRRNAARDDRHRP